MTRGLAAEIFASARKFSDKKINSNRLSGEVNEVSFGQFLHDVELLSHTLRNSGLRPFDQVAIRGPNCYEWLVWDIAIQVAGGVPVGLPYDDNSSDTTNLDQKNGIILLVTPNPTPNESYSVQSLGDIKPSSLPLQKSTNSTALAGDSYTRSYSSGTSGVLKGLEISEEGTRALLSEFVDDFDLSSKDRFLIFLPFSNYQQRMLAYMCLLYGIDFCVCGTKDVFFRGRSFAPTFLVAPPSFYENLLRIQSASQEGNARPLGASLRLLITGMAPISRETIEQLSAKIAPTYEVYGVVECGMISWNSPRLSKLGTVGKPLPTAEVALGDDDEVLVKKANPLSCGYFHAREGDMAKTFPKPGYVATGDLGAFDSEGFLVLKGRKKDAIVTKGGAKYDPASVEIHFENQKLYSDITVFGSYDGQDLFAVVVPNPGINENEILSWLQDRNKTSEAELRLTKVIISDVIPSVENGMLTRNLKKSRATVSNFFSEYRSTTIV